VDDLKTETFPDQRVFAFLHLYGHAAHPQNKKGKFESPCIIERLTEHSIVIFMGFMNQCYMPSIDDVLVLANSELVMVGLKVPDIEVWNRASGIFSVLSWARRILPLI
jgi:hypothetical protein